MRSRKFALAMAKQLRKCPSIGMDEHPDQLEMYAAHVKSCPYCSEKNGWDPWEILTEELKKVLVDSGAKLAEQRVKPGQLRFVNPERAGWDDLSYYNSPMVLVLENTQVIGDDVLVALTYHDPLLAARADLILSEEQTDCVELFVETWNVFTLKASNLGGAVGKVSPWVLNDVQKMREDSSYSPDWALRPRPLMEMDPRNFFRDMEVEVGHYFSVRDVAELMKEFEEYAAWPQYPSIEDISNTLKPLGFSLPSSLGENAKSAFRMNSPKLLSISLNIGEESVSPS